MKFSTRKDIAAKADLVFARLADFGTFEREALRRGVSLRRLDTLARPGPGMSWELGFRFRGRDRQVVVDLAEYEPPERLSYHGQSGSFEMRLDLQLTELSKTRTRLQVALEVKPRNLASRLMLQSVKLGKGKLDQRFEKRVGGFVDTIEREAQA